MKLELDQIARRRRQLNAGDVSQRPMDYLTSRIERDLLDRIELQGSGITRWLVVDTHQSLIELDGIELLRISPLEGDSLEQLDKLPAAGLGGAVINLQLAWLDPKAVFDQLRRIIAPGGRLFFSSLGPDTLAELRQAWSLIDDSPHVHPFIDMHHLGDMLMRSGFSKPIMGADWIGVEYDDVDLLMEDLRKEGAHNVLETRRKTLTGKNRIAQLRQHFEHLGKPAQITFEIIFGYAEVPIEGGAIKVNAPVFEPPA